MEKECKGLNVRGCARALATVVGDGRERGEWGCGQSQCGGGEGGDGKLSRDDQGCRLRRVQDNMSFT